MTTDYQMDNLLVDQKDQLIGQIQACEDLLAAKDWKAAVTDYTCVLTAINILRPLWIAENYGYKTNELLARVHNGIQFAILDMRPSKARAQLREIAQLTIEIRIKGIHADFAATA